MQHAGISVLCANIAKFDRTDADTDFLAEEVGVFDALGGRSFRGARRLDDLNYVGCTLFLARMCIEDARIYSCTVAYMINYHVHVYKLHDRRILSGQLCVGPVELKL